MLQVRHLSKSYTSGSLVYPVLKDVSLRVEKGEFVAVMGPSGSGKTTLLNCISCFIPHEQGSIVLADQDISDLNETELARVRNRQMGFVFQDFYLMDSLTVEENIMLPLILDKANEEKCFSCAREQAEHFRIDHLIRKYPYELSGGERQRVAICRALINEPDLILADEPTGNLDSKSGKIVIEALNRINRQYKKTIVMVTHDPQVASNCSRIIFLKDGLILNMLERGESQEEFYQQILGHMADL